MTHPMSWTCRQANSGHVTSTFAAQSALAMRQAASEAGYAVHRSRGRVRGPGSVASACLLPRFGPLTGRSLPAVSGATSTKTVYPKAT